VDTDTESEIIETLRRRSGAHTTLIIAHRLSTLMHADRILVLERGRIAQSGSHVELSRADGIYRRLWKLESALEEELADGGEPSSGSPEGSGR
jgi:ATP-binding cassette subfamily B protein